MVESTITPVYMLSDFRNIIFNGFDIKLPEETISIITQLAEQVGSPTYIRTPVFAKKDPPPIRERLGDLSGKKKRRSNQMMETVLDEDWESLRTFHTTKIEQKVGVDAQLDLIRSCLNKITDKNYEDQCGKIMDILDQLNSEESSRGEMLRVGNMIFEIASNNRFYSKIYADLYTKLINHYEVMKTVFENNLCAFLTCFEKIEYVNSEEDYDRFCKINIENERRKALSTFFVNLYQTGIIPGEKLIEFATNLLKQVLVFIHQENRKNEVDEMVENIAILYQKDLFLETTDVLSNRKTFMETVEMLAISKTKMFASLSNKSIFKFMDIMEM